MKKLEDDYLYYMTKIMAHKELLNLVDKRGVYITWINAYKLEWNKLDRPIYKVTYPAERENTKYEKRFSWIIDEFSTITNLKDTLRLYGMNQFSDSKYINISDGPKVHAYELEDGFVFQESVSPLEAESIEYFHNRKKNQSYARISLKVLGILPHWSMVLKHFSPGMIFNKKNWQTDLRRNLSEQSYQKVLSHVKANKISTEEFKKKMHTISVFRVENYYLIPLRGIPYRPRFIDIVTEENSAVQKMGVDLTNDQIVEMVEKSDKVFWDDRPF